MGLNVLKSLQVLQLFLSQLIDNFRNVFFLVVLSNTFCEIILVLLVPPSFYRTTVHINAIDGMFFLQ